MCWTWVCQVGKEGIYDKMRPVRLIETTFLRQKKDHVNDRDARSLKAAWCPANSLVQRWILALTVSSRLGTTGKEIPFQSLGFFQFELEIVIFLLWGSRTKIIFRKIGNIFDFVNRTVGCRYSPLPEQLDSGHRRYANWSLKEEASWGGRRRRKRRRRPPACRGSVYTATRSTEPSVSERKCDKHISTLGTQQL